MGVCVWVSSFFKDSLELVLPLGASEALYGTVLGCPAAAEGGEAIS